MADRTPQYPMLPTNFAPSLAGQGASLNQQQQQPQDSSQHSVGGLANPDHSRMWQQMQHQMQQQQHNRATSGVSGDISGSQVNQQMADFLRNQNLVQGQQQQQRPAFGLGPPGGIGVSQPPPFPDMQGNNLGNFTQNNNNPMSQLNPSQLQAAFQQNRNNPMFQALQNQPQVTRQLELMGMAHNQQPQNGPVTLTARLNQQQQPGQQGFHPNMGAGGANAVGGQPGQGNPGGMVPSFNGASAMETRRAALLELRDKAVHLYNGLKLVEQQRVTLANQRAGLSESMFLQRDSVLEQDCAKKREVLTKWNAMLIANGMHSVGGSVPGMNQMGSSSAPHNNMVQQNAQAQPNWMSAQQQQGLQGQSQQSGAQSRPIMTEQINPQQLIPYAFVPVAELRMRGMSENAINWIDERRIAIAYDHHAQSTRNTNQTGQLQSQAQQQQGQSQQSGAQTLPSMPEQVNPQALIPYAYVPVAELRMRGLPENAIYWINERRISLQKAYDYHAQQRVRDTNQTGQLQSQAQQQQGLQGQSQQSGAQPLPSMPEQVNPQPLIPSPGGRVEDEGDARESNTLDRRETYSAPDGLRSLCATDQEYEPELGEFL